MDEDEGLRRVECTVWHEGELASGNDSVAVEEPVALVYNGISHAVMMATPRDLEDFALGFSFTEGIIDHPGELLDCEVHQLAAGIELQLQVSNRAFAALKDHRRNLAGRTGCGICGAEALEQIVVTPAQVNNPAKITSEAVQSALQRLASSQSLHQRTGGVHAAAWSSDAGDILLVREDVGRHNALDKLIGALLAADTGRDGFVLVSSRASYEMVLKTAKAGIGVLAAVSAPTSLAIELAGRCGITLLAFTRPGRQVVYTGARRLAGSE